MANVSKLREALAARLDDLAGVGGRIYGGDVPEDTVYPYVLSTLASGGPAEYSLDGAEALAAPAFLVRAVGLDGGGFDDLRPIADDLDALLSGWRVEPGPGVELPFYVEREGEVEERFPLAGSSFEFVLGAVYRFSCTPGGAG